jgi:hypothetical protein
VHPLTRSTEGAARGQELTLQAKGSAWIGKGRAHEVENRSSGYTKPSQTAPLSSGSGKGILAGWKNRVASAAMLGALAFGVTIGLPATRSLAAPEPTTVAAAADSTAVDKTLRVELAPTGKDNGKRFYFVYSFVPEFPSGIVDGLIDRELRFSISDDVTALRNKGYTVVIETDASKKSIFDAMYDRTTAGLVWIAHGYNGAVSTHDGGWIRSREIDSARISPNMKVLAIESCYSEDDRGWAQKFNKSKVITFPKVRTYTLIHFNSSGLADMIRDQL